jgi:predicted NAD/FAD-dependent oxidoreductase
MASIQRGSCQFFGRPSIEFEGGIFEVIEVEVLIQCGDWCHGGKEEHNAP